MIRSVVDAQVVVSLCSEWQRSHGGNSILPKDCCLLQNDLSSSLTVLCCTVQEKEEYAFTYYLSSILVLTFFLYSISGYEAICGMRVPKAMHHFKSQLPSVLNLE